MVAIHFTQPLQNKGQKESIFGQNSNPDLPISFFFLNHHSFRHSNSNCSIKKQRPFRMTQISPIACHLWIQTRWNQSRLVGNGLGRGAFQKAKLTTCVTSLTICGVCMHSHMLLKWYCVEVIQTKMSLSTLDSFGCVARMLILVMLLHTRMQWVVGC